MPHFLTVHLTAKQHLSWTQRVFPTFIDDAQVLRVNVVPRFFLGGEAGQSRESHCKRNEYVFHEYDNVAFECKCNEYLADKQIGRSLGKNFPANFSAKKSRTKHSISKKNANFAFG